MRAYKHKQFNGENIDLPVGKVVCVGRNYAEHAKELGNPVPQAPLLFIKPKTAIVDFSQPFAIPENQGVCHFETEIAVLIKKDLTKADSAQVTDAIWGYGVAFDLTLRDLQNNLKQLLPQMGTTFGRAATAEVISRHAQTINQITRKNWNKIS